MNNMFYQINPRTGKPQLDRQYLRICAVFKLLKQRRIDKRRAEFLLEARGVRNPGFLVRTWMIHLERNDWLVPAIPARQVELGA